MEAVATHAQVHLRTYTGDKKDGKQDSGIHFSTYEL